ncbi:hypothetical protein [Pontibacterium sp.]|uniref:hypothetical protein n=1 Tax=Pontibacterium sp. TaxID=2036026 RepID=UPI003515CA98
MNIKTNNRIKLYTVGPANHSTHRLLTESDRYTLIPRKRSAWVVYFFGIGVTAFAAMFTLVFMNGEIELTPYLIIIAVLSLILLGMVWLNKRLSNRVVIDKTRGEIYRTYKSRDRLPIKDVTGIDVVGQTHFGNIADDRSTSYRSVELILHSRLGDEYSLLNHADRDEILVIAQQLAEFLGLGEAACLYRRR